MKPTKRPKFDPAILFEPFKPDPKRAPYSSLAEVLDAVAARKKAMYYSGFPLSMLASGDEQFAELLHMAIDRDLTVVIHNRRIPFPLERQEPDVFVLPIEESWRVPAFAALRDAAFEGDGRWSNAAEAQSSYLLGYTAQQRRRWIAWQKERQAAWTCKTIYTLLTLEQKQLVLDVGRRCFGPALSLVGRAFFFHRQNDGVKKTAARLVPRDLTLARVGLAWKATRTFFGDFKNWKPRGLVTATATKKLAPMINAELLSNVQLLTSAGWK